jgi:hypothetical protein
VREGFSREEVFVITSNEGAREYFSRYASQDPSGAHTPEAVMAGGAVGAAIGAVGTTAAGAALVATGSTLGGLALTLAGGPLAWTGAIFGGFVGAMLTRGVEKNAADYYDQALVAGKILIGVEVHSAAAEARLAAAERILTAHGAEPVPLSEG